MTSMCRLAAVAVALLLIGGCSATEPAPAVPSDPAEYARDVVVETNAVRAEEGLTELTESDCARSAAAERAEALVGGAELEHAPLDGVIRDCELAARAAENLSRATVSPREVVEAWLDSPGHRMNLLDDELTEVGVACIPDDAAMLCSQVFLGE